MAAPGIFAADELLCEIEPYSRSRDKLTDGDVLLFRRPNSLIATTGRGVWSHAGMAIRTHGRVLCLEVREWYGGRAVMFSALVPGYPDGIDVFRVASANAARVQTAVQVMLEKTGEPYNYRGVVRAFLSRLPVLGRRYRSAAPGGEFCSQAVANAWAAAGIDLVPRLDDHATEPSDLARSSLLTEIVRVVP